jgi:WW domain
MKSFGPSTAGRKSCLVMLTNQVMLFSCFAEPGGGGGGYQQQQGYGQAANAYGGYQQQQQPSYGGHGGYDQQYQAAPYGRPAGGGHHAAQAAPYGQSAMGGYPAPQVYGHPQGVPAVQSEWKSATSPDGQVYYYNERTGETQWEKPIGMP